MQSKPRPFPFLFLVLALSAGPALTGGAAAQGDSTDPPASPVRLVFVHHSTGGFWLADDNGGLGIALRDNNYYVSATNYGTGPDSIGDRTDVINWPEWFTGEYRDTYLAWLYALDEQNFGDFGSWSRMGTNPGGENVVILFKSCFPNSNLYGNPSDPPDAVVSDAFTVGNFKAVYNNLLTYFTTRQDKLFVVILAPPYATGEWDFDYGRAANARAFNNWMMTQWLASYPHPNVAVFDFYNVLTSNGGNADTNDLGWASGNHHRWWSGAVQHQQTVDINYAAYPTDDSHPSQAGNVKSTEEFVPLLNVFYNRWHSGASPLQYSDLARYLASSANLPAGQTGDANGDGVVDALDLVYLLTH